MKAPGIVRKADILSGIVLPIEFQENTDIIIQNPLKIYAKEDVVIPKIKLLTCILCKSMVEAKTYTGKSLCISVYWN